MSNEATETMEPTEAKAPESKNKTKDKTKAAPPKAGKMEKAEKPASKAEKAPGSSGLAEREGYAKIFENWEPIPCEEGVRMVDPTKVYEVFDVRAGEEALEEQFLASTKAGIKTPPCITRMKYVGESTGEFKKGQDYDITVYGRRRLKAARKHKHKETACTVRAYKTWQEMVTDAWDENTQRQAPTAWDAACVCKNYRDAGFSTDQIAERLHTKASFVTQHLQVHKLSDGAKTAVRQGKLGISAVRSISGLPEEQQDAFTARAIDRGWDATRLIEEVKNWRAKNDGKSETGRTPKQRVSRVTDYAEATLKARPVAVGRTMLTNFKTKIKQLRKDEADAEKIKYHEGVLVGMEYAYQLREPPAQALVEPEDDEDADDEEASED